MGYTTVGMGLKVWNQPNDQFSRAELAANWEKINDHDHTPGNGVPLPGTALQDGSISGNLIADEGIAPGKLGDDAVVAANIADGEITRGKIDDEAINSDKLEANAVTNSKILDGAVSGDKIPNGGVAAGKLANNSVVTANIAAQNVTTAKIADSNITTIKIADENVTESKLADAAVTSRVLNEGIVAHRHLLPNVVPVGTVIPWFRPSDLTDVPVGWVIPIGQTLSNAQHDFAESGNIDLPDLRNRFILGSDTSNTGSGAGTPPAIGSEGGPADHATSFSHTHTMAHTHTVAAHTHKVGGSSHRHRFIDPLNPGQLTHLHQRGSGVKLRADDPGSTWRQGAYVAGVNSAFEPNTNHDSGDILMELHNEPEKTSDANTTGTTTGASSAATTGAPSSGTTIDARPSFVGLLFLMKVLNDPD